MGTGMSAYATEQEPAGMNRWRSVCPMAFRTLSDMPCGSQNSHVGSRVGPDGFNYCGAFADTLCVFCHCFRYDSNQHEQQQFLHHRVASGVAELPPLPFTVAI